MKNNKKLLFLAMFIFVMTGCGVCHKNIVKSIYNNNMLIEDVETHQERILELSEKHENRTFLKYTLPGDTILVKTPYYEERLVIQSCFETRIYCNYDSLYLRESKHEFETRKQQLFPGKSR